MIKLLFLLIVIYVSGCSYEKSDEELITFIENENISEIKKHINSKKSIEFYYYDGFTPLTYAVTVGCYKCVVTLVEGGVEINKIQRGGLSALSWAVVRDDTLIAKYLLDAGANYNIKCDGDKCFNSRELAKKYKRMDILNLIMGAQIEP